MSYWSERVLSAQRKYSNKNINSINKQLIKYYGRSAKRVIASFEETYLKVLENIKQGEPVSVSDLYKLDSYWKMQSQLSDELQKLGEKEVSLYTKLFEGEYRDVYKALAVEGESTFTQIDAEKAKVVAQEIWCTDGKHWSDRVWTNLNYLKDTLNEELADCILTGRKTTELEQRLMQRFGVSYNQANTLVRTEIAHIETQATIDRYKNMGVKLAKVLVDDDERTCEECVTKEKVIDLYSSTEVPPFHPNCRCCLIPILDGE